jgi:hypothetical protein
VLMRMFGGSPSSPNPAPGAAAGQGRPSVADQVMTISLGGLLLIAAVIGILVLAALWLERTRPPADDLVEETRTIDRGAGNATPRRPRRRRFGRVATPADAAAAYVALVRDLDDHRAVRRVAGETPAEHAARLRSAGLSPLSLDLLAADYALARYAGVRLPPREDSRAVRRWRSLRGVLVRAKRPE